MEVIVNSHFKVDKTHETISFFASSSTWDVLINICVRTELGRELDGSGTCAVCAL